MRVGVTIPLRHNATRQAMYSSFSYHGYDISIAVFQLTSGPGAGSWRGNFEFVHIRSSADRGRVAPEAIYPSRKAALFHLKEEAKVHIEQREERSSVAAVTGLMPPPMLNP